ncbi:hypothetical protein J4228_02715 [Candidatus Woesearchaeota archaeon]|nr:hypothetical protein [Candidatus Woesearchaeota archaeon]
MNRTHFKFEVGVFHYNSTKLHFTDPAFTKPLDRDVFIGRAQTEKEYYQCVSYSQECVKENGLQATLFYQPGYQPTTAGHRVILPDAWFLRSETKNYDQERKYHVSKNQGKIISPRLSSGETTDTVYFEQLSQTGYPTYLWDPAKKEIVNTVSKQGRINLQFPDDLEKKTARFLLFGGYHDKEILSEKFAGGWFYVRVAREYQRERSGSRLAPTTTLGSRTQTTVPLVTPGSSTPSHKKVKEDTDAYVSPSKNHTK